MFILRCFALQGRLKYGLEEIEIISKPTSFSNMDATLHSFLVWLIFLLLLPAKYFIECHTCQLK